jgi:hypothetical protein
MAIRSRCYSYYFGFAFRGLIDRRRRRRRQMVEEKRDQRAT